VAKKKNPKAGPAAAAAAKKQFKKKNFEEKTDAETENNAAPTASTAPSAEKSNAETELIAASPDVFATPLTVHIDQESGLVFSSGVFTISGTATQFSTVTVEIRNTSGAATNPAITAGTNPCPGSWTSTFGTNANPVPNGMYFVNATATKSGQTATESKIITVET